MKILWTYFMHSLYSCSRAAHSLPPLALLFSSHWTLGHPDHKTKSVPKYLTMDLFRGMGSSACDQPKRAITKTKNLTIFRLFVCVFFIFGPQNILSCCFVKRRNSIENMRQKPTSKWGASPFLGRAAAVAYIYMWTFCSVTLGSSSSPFTRPFFVLWVRGDCTEMMQARYY